MGEDEERFSTKTCCGGSDDDSVANADTDYDRRYAELFRQLDLNKDGKVDISELRTALAARGLHQGTAEEVRQSDAAGVHYIRKSHKPNKIWPLGWKVNLVFIIIYWEFWFNLIEKYQRCPKADSNSFTTAVAVSFIHGTRSSDDPVDCK